MRNGSMPVRRRSASLIFSSLPTASDNAALTHCGGLPFVSSGRHRLQGRYPAKSASRAFEKYSTFRGSGFLAGHDGRQNIPVVRTPRKKMPSYEASFARYAPCISLVGGIVFMRSLFLESEQRFHRFLDVDFRNRLLS